jgi:hypothetical protein
MIALVYKMLMAFKMLTERGSGSEKSGAYAIVMKVDVRLQRRPQRLKAERVTLKGI